MKCILKQLQSLSNVASPMILFLLSSIGKFQLFLLSYICLNGIKMEVGMQPQCDV